MGAISKSLQILGLLLLLEGGALGMSRGIWNASDFDV